MALTQLNQLAIAFKKLAGRTHTNSNFGVGNEAIGSQIQLGSSTIFGGSIPVTPTSSLFSLTGNVEKVRFELVALPASQYTPIVGALTGTTIDDQGDGVPNQGTYTNGIHAYALRLTGSYNTDSSNPNKGSNPFTNGYFVSGSNGTLQLVPDSYGADYIANVLAGTTTIFPGNEIDYYLDYYSGILFVQDYSAATIPTFIDAYIYVGKYLDTVVSDLSGSISGVSSNKITEGNITASVATGSEVFAVVSGSQTLLSVNSNKTVEVSGSLLVTGSITATTTGFTPGLNIEGDTIGTIILKTTGSNGFAITADSTNGLSIYDVNDARTRFFMNDSGSFGFNTSQTADYAFNVSGNAAFTNDVTITGSLLVSGSITGSLLGTSSYALEASSSLSSSYAATASIATTASYALSASYVDSISASIVNNISGNLLIATETGVISGSSDLHYNQVSKVLTAAVTGNFDYLNVAKDMVITGDLTVNGTASIINTENLYVTDRFILLASGSTTATDGGIIINSSASGEGYAFGYSSGSARWVYENDLSGSAVQFDTPAAYAVTAEYGLAVAKPGSPSYGNVTGYGNIWVSTDTGEIFIYA
jgi:hypothetical protein